MSDDVDDDDGDFGKKKTGKSAKKTGKATPAKAAASAPNPVTPASLPAPGAGAVQVTKEKEEAVMAVFDGATACCDRWTADIGCLARDPVNLFGGALAAAGMTMKDIKVELKGRGAVIGGTRVELLQRIRELLHGTYSFK